MTQPPTANSPASGAESASPAAEARGGPSRRFPAVRLFGGAGDIPPRPAGAEPATRSETALVKALQLVARAAAVMIVLGGATVLLGWQLGDRGLQAVGPADVVMNPLAALLFILTGSVLLLDGEHRMRGLANAWGVGAGLFIAISGGLVMMRTIAGWQVGIDDFLFREAVLSIDPPDWMAENTALNFLLLGSALVFRRVKMPAGWRPAHWLVVPAALMSLLVVIGYLYDTAGFITFQLELPMALNTAIFFLFACFALVAAHPNEGVMRLFVSDSAGGKMTRRLLPALLLVPLILGAVINLGMLSGAYGPTVALALLTLATIVLSVLLTVTTAGALHRSDRRLRASEEHFRALIENSSDYIMIVDQRGAITYVGPSVERLLGYTPDEVMGMTPDILVHRSDVPKVRETLARIFANPGQVERLEFRIRHRNGSWRIFESYGRTLRPDSVDAGAVANARDITDRREAEDELGRQKAYFEDILNSLDAGIVVFDPRGRFEYASESALREPHIRKWVVGKTMEDYGRAKKLTPEVMEVRQRSLDDAIRLRTRQEFEQEIRRPDGTPWMMLRRVVPIVNEAGELERVVAFSVDITERKAAESAMQAAKEEAERANRAKSEFLSRMSHELRTPLNAILGFAQVLERKGLPAEQLGHLAHILKGGKHLLSLINEVLDLSRIESGRLALSLEPVCVSDVLREAMDLVKPLANELGNEMMLEEPARGGIYVMADRQRLSQIVINLLSNAIKYNRAGGQVRIRLDSTAAGVSIRVKDSGRGIPVERLDQLFTPFARLGAEQTETEGTGLGLALSRRLSEAMGGLLELEETGSAGSVFRLDLRSASDPMLSPRVAEAVANGASDDDGRVAATILYIEDNLTNLSLVEAVLESKPCWRTISALRGEAGLELAREKKPDLILLDLHLPDMSGNEVLARLRSNVETRQIPVVIISADATTAAQDRLKAAGADAYLTKPLDLDEFLAVVENFLPA